MRKTFYRQNLIWGIFLIVFGIAALLENMINLGIWGWAGVLFAAGALALVVSVSERAQLVNLIPTYVTWVIGLMLALIGLNILRGTGIATYVLFSVALPFLIGYLRNRSLWGLLIPAYVLFSVGIMVGLIGLGWLVDLLIPAYVMFCIAFPFLVVYFRNREHWWALIPAGIMFVIGFAFILATPSVRFLAPLFLVIAGGWLIVRQFTHKRG